MDPNKRHTNCTSGYGDNSRFCRSLFQTRAVLCQRSRSLKAEFHSMQNVQRSTLSERFVLKYKQQSDMNSRKSRLLVYYYYILRYCIVLLGNNALYGNNKTSHFMK